MVEIARSARLLPPEHLAPLVTIDPGGSPPISNVEVGLDRDEIGLWSRGQ